MIVFYVVVFVLAFVIQEVSIHRARKKENIGYSCTPSVDSCEPGDEFLVHSIVTNLYKASSPVLRIEERFPNRIEICEAGDYNVKTIGSFRFYNSTVTIKGRQRVKRYLRCRIDARGEYRFANAEFHAGDFLGFVEYDYTKENDASIVIYPALITDSEFIKTFADSFDELALSRRLLEDPISVCGYRDYTGREPLRSISWKQTAVRGSIIAKEYDPTWKEAVTVVLDEDYHGEHDLHAARQEYCFSMARTICDFLETRNVAYRLITNAIISEDISTFQSTGGKGEAYRRILYSLGAAQCGAVRSAGELLARACLGAYREKTIVFISTRRDDMVRDALEHVRSIGGAQLITLYAEDYLASEDVARGGGINE